MIKHIIEFWAPYHPRLRRKQNDKSFNYVGASKQRHDFYLKLLWTLWQEPFLRRKVSRTWQILLQMWKLYSLFQLLEQTSIMTRSIGHHPVQPWQPREAQNELFQVYNKGSGTASISCFFSENDLSGQDLSGWHSIANGQSNTRNREQSFTG